MQVDEKAELKLGALVASKGDHTWRGPLVLLEDATFDIFGDSRVLLGGQEGAEEDEEEEEPVQTRPLPLDALVLLHSDSAQLKIGQATQLAARARIVGDGQLIVGDQLSFASLFGPSRQGASAAMQEEEEEAPQPRAPLEVATLRMEASARAQLLFTDSAGAQAMAPDADGSVLLALLGEATLGGELAIKISEAALGQGVRRLVLRHNARVGKFARVSLNGEAVPEAQLASSTNTKNTKRAVRADGEGWAIFYDARDTVIELFRDDGESGSEGEAPSDADKDKDKSAASPLSVAASAIIAALFAQC